MVQNNPGRWYKVSLGNDCFCLMQEAGFIEFDKVLRKKVKEYCNDSDFD